MSAGHTRVTVWIIGVKKQLIISSHSVERKDNPTATSYTTLFESHCAFILPSVFVLVLYSSFFWAVLESL